MANVEINDITLKGTPATTDELEIQETGGGTSKKITIDSILDLVSGALIDVQVFTADGTWNKPTGTNSVEVWVIGGGGGGGGNVATGADACGLGGGGGGGSFDHILSGLGSTETVTVGDGGTAPSGLAGTAGGTSSFGSHLQATGGDGGTNFGATGLPNWLAHDYTPIDGGVGTLGAINLKGEHGGHMMGLSNSHARGGDGGAAANLQFGGASQRAIPTTSFQVGTVGLNYGGGGSGSGTDAASNSARAGGPGAPGIVVVKSYT